MILAPDILLIADDSSLCKTVNSMLNEHVKSPVAFVSGMVAMAEVIRRRPRIVFIQDDLRGADGIRLGKEILNRRQSTVVLIARNELRAVDAYEAGIPDFLLTPFRRERLLAALSRGLQRVDAQRSRGWTRTPQASRPPLRFKSKRGFVFIRHDEILWISAAANYLDIHCAEGSHRVRGTLAETASRLSDHRHFLRIHRSILINASYLREVCSSGTGDCVAVMHDFRELPVSRKHVLDEWMVSTRNLPAEPPFVLGPRAGDPTIDRVSAQRSAIEIQAPSEPCRLLRTS